MIPFLRACCLCANAAVFAGVPLLLGAPLPAALGVALVLFALVAWACARAPRGAPAPPELFEEACELARAMSAREPKYLRMVPGWTAGAVRSGAGYGLVLGCSVEPEHRAPVLAHEIAHHLAGDLFWEPLTDGPARVVLDASRRVPPLFPLALPFLPFGIPLAWATEHRADSLACRAVPSYPVMLRRIAAKMGDRGGTLHPTLARRILESARYSLEFRSSERPAPVDTQPKRCQRDTA